jgi:Flp pilus assembly protein TadD
LLFGLVAWAFLPAVRNGFINLDDGVYVYDNARVKNGLTWENIRWASTTLYFGIWHPLTWMSHMLDCQWFGLRPGGHHLTSVLLHAANAMLLFVVLRRMTGALWRPALVAALFGLHPLHVESVAWVAERKDVLSTFFVMLALWAYARYAVEECRRQKAEGKIGAKTAVQRATKPGSSFGILPSLFYLLSLLFFALGLMSKPMVVTLPVVLLLLDYWPLRRFELSTLRSQPSTILRLVVEKLPFVVAAVLVSWITLRGAHQEGWTASVAHYALTNRIANATYSYARYFLQVFWPTNLVAYYPLPATFPAWSVARAALLLLGISVASFCVARRWPYIVVGWLWYLATLLPVIGLVIQLASYSHADRYTYVPLIGLFVSLVWGGWELVRHWRRSARACVAAAVAAAIVLCVALTRQQLGYWTDAEALFRHALAVTRDNWMAHNNLGTALYRQGRYEEAILHFQECVRLQPRYPPGHLNLGNAFNRTGHVDESIRAYQTGLDLKPEEAEAQYSLATLLIGKGLPEEAIRHFQEVLRLQPNHAEAHNNLGTVLYQQGRTAEAIGQFQEALKFKPDYADARKNLDVVLGTKADSSKQPDAR